MTKRRKAKRMTQRCLKHPSYKGKRMPIDKWEYCPACWSIWYSKMKGVVL